MEVVVHRMSPNAGHITETIPVEQVRFDPAVESVVVARTAVHSMEELIETTANYSSPEPLEVYIMPRLVGG